MLQHIVNFLCINNFFVLIEYAAWQWPIVTSGLVTYDTLTSTFFFTLIDYII